MYYEFRYLTFNDIFNPMSINIFSDGSILNLNNGSAIGCPGAIIVYFNEYGSEIIYDTYTDLINNTTNNDTEIRSIFLGLSVLNSRYKSLLQRTTNINIFSDSKICICGLREWIYSWMSNTHNGVLYNSSGEPVKNQDMFIETAREIIEIGKTTNLYHQKGHVKHSDSSIDNARKVFYESNGYMIRDRYLLETISYYNNLIDKITKNDLNDNKDMLVRQQYKIRPFRFSPDKVNMPRYLELTNKNKKGVV